MDKRISKIVKKEFEVNARNLFPAYEKLKGRLYWPGSQVGFSKKTDENISFFFSLIIHPRHNEFTFEIGWSIDTSWPDTMISLNNFWEIEGQKIIRLSTFFTNFEKWFKAADYDFNDNDIDSITEGVHQKIIIGLDLIKQVANAYFPLVLEKFKNDPLFYTKKENFDEHVYIEGVDWHKLVS